MGWGLRPARNWGCLPEMGKIMHKTQRSKQPGMFGNPEGSGILKFKEPETRLMSWEW